MKIKEILELTQLENVATIAKNHLTIGEKKLRDALKTIGCTNQAGKKGWTYTGENPEILEKSIYEFAQPTATKKKETQKSNNKENKEPTKPENNDIINSNKQESRESIITENNPINKQENKKNEQKNTQESPIKKVTYEIEERIHDELKIRSIREKRKVSDLVNEALKAYLK